MGTYRSESARGNGIAVDTAGVPFPAHTEPEDCCPAEEVQPRQPWPEVRAALDGFSREQFREGVDLLLAHGDQDHVGQCMRCGEPVPCTAIQRGVLLCRVYVDWSEAGRPPVPEHPPDDISAAKAPARPVAVGQR